MNHEMPDLNALREEVQLNGLRVSIDEPEDDTRTNTLERFEALPLEEQLERMRRKEYTDLELFKKKHFNTGIDINLLRRQIKSE